MFTPVLGEFKNGRLGVRGGYPASWCRQSFVFPVGAPLVTPGAGTAQRRDAMFMPAVRGCGGSAGGHRRLGECLHRFQGNSKTAVRCQRLPSGRHKWRPDGGERLIRRVRPAVLNFLSAVLSVLSVYLFSVSAVAVFRLCLYVSRMLCADGRLLQRGSACVAGGKTNGTPGLTAKGAP